jgi:ornithine carbamoyltransferase
MTIGAMAGMTVRVSSPTELGPTPEDLTAAEVFGELHGGSVVVVEDPKEAVAGADAIITGPWPQAGDPADRRRLHERLARYRVTLPLLALADNHAVVLHHLPVHRGEEIAEAVVEHPHAMIWREAANRVPVEQAVVYALSTAGEPAA